MDRDVGKNQMPFDPARLRETDLEEGFYVALRNSRGVTTRRANDGGDQERDLVAMYRSDAKTAGAANVRTRALLNKIADSYGNRADEEDQGAEPSVRVGLNASAS
jgi:hypothetical protein